MVMMFAVKEAREQLEKEGIVYTLRPYPRKQLEYDWYNYFRGDTSKGRIFIQYVRTIYDFPYSFPIKLELEEFVGESGFKTVSDWLKRVKIRDMTVYLYRVRLVEKY
jgi:hypothetical protein